MVLRNIWIIFISTFIYSVLRYNIIGDIPFSDIPTLIVNKAIAFSIIIILFLAFLSYFYKRQEDHKTYLFAFKIFTLMHVILSLVVLTQNNYSKIITNEKIPLLGNLAVLAGVLSFAYISVNRFRIRYIILFLLITAHLFFLGCTKWLEPEKWYGWMPPITLICFLIMAGLIIFFLSSKNFKDIEFNN